MVCGYYEQCDTHMKSRYMHTVKLVILAGKILENFYEDFIKY